MDIIIFGFTIIISLIFIFLYIKDRTIPFLAIVGGTFFILSGVPLVAGSNLETQYCEYTINTTAIMGDNNQTTSYTYLPQCSLQTLSWPWNLQEAYGVFFILIGIGTFLSAIPRGSKDEEEED